MCPTSRAGWRTRSGPDRSRSSCARNPERVAAEVTGGRDTVGLRVPDHPLALALLDAFGGGVAAPSANRFGKVSPTTAAHVRADLGDDVAVVLDGGPCRVGVESTIVDVTGPEPAILRVGGVSRAPRSSETIGHDRARCERAVRSPRPERWRRTTRPTQPSRVIDARQQSPRERMRTRRLGSASACSHSSSLRASCPTNSSCSMRHATSTSTRASSTRGCGRPTSRASTCCSSCLPPETDGLGAAVADRVWRASRAEDHSERYRARLA